jgi:hypothetical protein
MSQTVDVTGLTPESVRLVERLVASLRAGRDQGVAPAPGSEPGEAWRIASEAVAGLADYDFGAWEEQRAFDQHHGQDHLK